MVQYHIQLWRYWNAMPDALGLVALTLVPVVGTIDLVSDWIKVQLSLSPTTTHFGFKLDHAPCIPWNMTVSAVREIVGPVTMTIIKEFFAVE